MRRAVIGALLASAMLLPGCASQGNGSLEITENGTYDVSGYSQVVVNVGGGEAEESTAEESVSSEDLNLVRVQFRDFSMEVPAEMVEGFTDQELSENSHMTLFGKDVPNKTTYRQTTLDFTTMETLGALTLDQASDAPQEEINGITMAIRHQHVADSRDVEASFIYNDILYTVHLAYMTDFDEKYGEYADQFYRTIQMN